MEKACARALIFYSKKSPQRTRATSAGGILLVDTTLQITIKRGVTAQDQKAATIIKERRKRLLGYYLSSQDIFAFR